MWITTLCLWSKPRHRDTHDLVSWTANWQVTRRWDPTQWNRPQVQPLPSDQQHVITPETTTMLATARRQDQLPYG
ncbi:MAG: hypothetical protein ACREXR_11290 [Gammaproteobacteria bacterium]